MRIKASTKVIIKREKPRSYFIQNKINFNEEKVLSKTINNILILENNVIKTRLYFPRIFATQRTRLLLLPIRNQVKLVRKKSLLKTWNEKEDSMKYSYMQMNPPIMRV